MVETRRKTWSQISTTKALMEDLENNDAKQAVGKVFEQFRFLLREAIILENKFNVETIKKWRSTGKLSSQWQERQALQLLETREINAQEAKELEPEHRIWDELPEENELNHHTARLNKILNKSDSKSIE